MKQEMRRVVNILRWADSCCRFPAECSDWGALPLCKHVDGPELLPCSGFHYAHLCKYTLSWNRPIDHKIRVIKMYSNVLKF